MTHALHITDIISVEIEYEITIDYAGHYTFSIAFPDHFQVQISGYESGLVSDSSLIYNLK